MRVLVVEDNVEFYETYLLRLFQTLLPLGSVILRHAATIEEAKTQLCLGWDVIVMDFYLGAKFKDEQGQVFKDGHDLVQWRRQLEVANQDLKPAWIIGFSSAEVANRNLLEIGANVSYSKLKVEELAQEILGRL